MALNRTELLTLASALPAKPDEFAAWSAWLRAIVAKLVAATEAADGRQDGPRWKLARDLARAGANTAWAVAWQTEGMGPRAELMRLGASHDRLGAALKLAYEPEVYVRNPVDTSALLSNFYGVPVTSEELLTARAKSDLAVLLTDPLTLNAARARDLLVRLPSGVLAWR